MTMDDELILIDKSYTTNAIGDSIPTETRTSILCGVQSVTRSEHYAAAARGLQPEIVFVVNQFEYGSQLEVEHGGKRYNVIRSYKPTKANDISDFENLELVCQGVR